MTVLLDTNVVLDLLLARKPFVQEAREIFLLIENGRLAGTLCATTVTTIHYLIQKELGKRKADETVRTLLRLFDIAQVDGSVLLEASRDEGSDYEDSVIAAAARRRSVSAIVTRDIQGFRHCDLDVMTPAEFLAFFLSTDDFPEA